MSLINQSAPTKDDNIGDYLPINWSWKRVNGKHNLKLLAEEIYHNRRFSTMFVNVRFLEMENVDENSLIATTMYNIFSQSMPDSPTLCWKQ